jgi:hypothetical protein
MNARKIGFLGPHSEANEINRFTREEIESQEVSPIRTWRGARTPMMFPIKLRQFRNSRRERGQDIKARSCQGDSWLTLPAERRLQFRFGRILVRIKWRRPIDPIEIGPRELHQ